MIGLSGKDALHDVFSGIARSDYVISTISPPYNRSEAI